MNGVDAIAFTAGVGENDKAGRKAICSYLGYLGVEIDDEANDIRGEERVISSANSKVKVMLIPTNGDRKRDPGAGAVRAHICARLCAGKNCIDKPNAPMYNSIGAYRGVSRYAD